MVPYLGDYSEDATVYMPFNTFNSNDPSASVTITNLADADIKVHKDGSATQIVTDGATVAIDFDSITGNHLVTVDTSAHADYATGSDYLVRMEGTTVDGATINAWIAHFSIENRHSAGALRPTVAGRTLDVSTGGEAGIDWANVGSPTTAVDLSQTDIQLCDTTTTNTDMVGTDNAATATALATAQTDLDTLTGADGATLATSQGNYAPSKAGDEMALTATALAAVMTTQMTESYAADGVAPTPAQALMLIQQVLTEFAINSTTNTAKKLDGSTTAATFTLDDDTSPTSSTRTT